MTQPNTDFHHADGTPKRVPPGRYQGPGDDELPLPVGLSHVWTDDHAQPKSEPDHGHRG